MRLSEGKKRRANNRIKKPPRGLTIQNNRTNYVIFILVFQWLQRPQREWTERV
jgi:hypothetical protein